MPVIQITVLGRFAVAVDGVPVAAAHWSRRHAAALVKVLALAPGRRLHREQVLDLVWPEEPIKRAAPKLHKAAHFARRAIDVPDAVVLRGDTILLGPDAEVSVDVDRFDELARAALAAGDATLARDALAAYGGELLPQDRYADWAERRREQLRLTHLDLLRLDGRWERVIELDDTDEPAHLALMRRYADNGDRHAALRQFERLDRALRRELGVAPAGRAVQLRDRLLAEHGAAPAPIPPMIGRETELAIAEKSLLGTAFGRSRVLIITGPAGVGKSSMVAAIAARAVESGFGVGHGTSAAVEGAWPYAPVVEALADLCRRRPGLLDGLRAEHRAEIDRALAGFEVSWSGASSHQRLFVAATELVRLAADSTGVLLTVDDVHEADDASLRLLHYIARCTRDQRVCLVLTHRPAPRAGTLSRDPPEPAGAARRGGDRAGSAGRDRCCGARAAVRPGPGPRAGRADRGARPGHPVRGERAGPPGRGRAAVGAEPRRQHDRWRGPGHPGGAAAGGRGRRLLRHRRVRGVVRAG